MEACPLRDADSERVAEHSLTGNGTIVSPLSRASLFGVVRPGGKLSRRRSLIRAVQCLLDLGALAGAFGLLSFCASSRLCLDRLSIDRKEFLDILKEVGVGASVHWRPLHLHPYYEETFGWRPEHFPVATPLWERLVSLPIFPAMREEERRFVVSSVTAICAKHRRRPVHAQTVAT